MSDPKFPIIDAHQHFWDPLSNYHPWLRDDPPIPFRYGDYSALRDRPFLPPEYLAAAGPHDIVQTVYIETEWDPSDPAGELDWVHALHADTGFPNAVVAQAWLDREDAAEVLADAASRALVRSVRHKPASAGSAAVATRDGPGSMDDRRWRDGFSKLHEHGLYFDLQTPWWHLDAALDLARDFSDATIVLNHTGLPADRSDAGLQGWHAAMSRLAEADNVVVKISGIGVPGTPWTVQANSWIVTETIQMFGVARCMFASNFPVDGLVVGMTELFAGFRDIVRGYSEADQRALFHDNALRIYRPVPAASKV
ncbi:MAG: thioesterase [Gammaproteobacteria bacterium]|nr:thioesterase [Gammaproteobacteria bacterium]